MATLEPPIVVNVTEGGVLGKKDGQPHSFTDQELAEKIADTGTLVTADALDTDTAALVEDSESAVRLALDAQYDPLGAADAAQEASQPANPNLTALSAADAYAIVSTKVQSLRTTTGMVISTAIDSGSDPTTELKIIARCSNSDWDSATSPSLAAKWAGSSSPPTNRAFRWGKTTSGRMFFDAGDGTTTLGTKLAAVHAFNDDEVVWFKVEYEVDTGAGQFAVRHYVAPDTGSPHVLPASEDWVLTATNTGTSIGPMPAAGVTRIARDGVSGSPWWIGSVSRVIFYNDVASDTPYADWVAVPGVVAPVDRYGNTWTPSGDWGWVADPF